MKELNTENLKESIAEFCDVIADDIELDNSLSTDLGLDTTTIALLGDLLSTEFQLDVNDEEISKCETVEDVSDLLQQKTNYANTR
jgi:acyl carrier protein